MKIPLQLLLALALTPTTLLAGCQGKGEHTAESPDLPRVVGKSLTGEYVALEDFRGKVVLLNVWATWCKPCKEELPALQALHDDHRTKGFTVLGVSVDSERSQPAVGQMVQQLGLTYPILLDPASRSVPALKVSAYPTSFIIGRDGRIVWRRDGIIQMDDAELLTNLQSALAGPAPG